VFITFERSMMVSTSKCSEMISALIRCASETNRANSCSSACIRTPDARALMRCSVAVASVELAWPRMMSLIPVSW
jgi:hypothetical protein